MRRLLARFKTSSGGWPKTSMIHANCSTSFSPGNKGCPIYNSAKIHPKIKKKTLYTYLNKNGMEGGILYYNTQPML